ncbi:MAG: hypothetical protein GVY04_21700 [Cyanobacteria bacterium]|jgi:hypothetical protein|nr:hypothetical protein [Cyanobacteria bacterium GSL.Bin1]
MSNALLSNSPNPSQVNSQENSPLIQLKQSLLQADQQAKFLHLQAEIESLWQQVKRSRLNDE